MEKLFKQILVFGTILILLASLGFATTIRDTVSTFDGGIDINANGLNATGTHTFTGETSISYTTGGARALTITNTDATVAAGILAIFNNAAGINLNFCTFGRTDSNGANYCVSDMETSGPIFSIYDNNETNDKITFNVVGRGTGEVQTWHNATAEVAKVLVNGSFYAKGGYHDYTAWEEKSDLQLVTEIKAIKGKNGEVDHTTWPDGLTGHDIVREYDEDQNIVSETEVETRDLSATVSWLTQLSQMYQREIEELHIELCKKDVTYGFC